MVQDEGGTLATRFVPEMLPPTGPPVHQGIGLPLPDVPADALLTCRLIPEAGTGEYGLLLRADAGQTTGYRLAFIPSEGRVTLRPWPDTGGETRAAAEGVESLDQSVSVTVCLKGSVIDVCLNDRHTLVERCFDHQGTTLGLFAEEGGLRAEGLRVLPLV